VRNRDSNLVTTRVKFNSVRARIDRQGHSPSYPIHFI
jgi:hypothetical protein